MVFYNQQIVNKNFQIWYLGYITTRSDYSGSMDNDYELDVEVNHEPETKRLIEQNIEVKNQEQEKLCRIGWQVLNLDKRR